MAKTFQKGGPKLTNGPMKKYGEFGEII